MIKDIRLDFISCIDDRYIALMSSTRQMFVAVDDLLKSLSGEAQERNLDAALRSIALARTYNEQSLQSAIKTLAILGEVK